MRKFVALVMAIITVFSAFAIVASAADIYTCPVCGKKYLDMGEYNDCIDSHADEETDDVKVFTCEVCGKKYYDLANYNACLDEHRNGTEHNYEHYIGVTLPELAQKLVASFNSSGVPALIKELITKVLDYIQDFIIYGAASRAAD